MFLIVGLGNPGTQYDLTRHNVGFMAVDILSSRHNAFLSNSSKFNSEIANCKIGNEKVILLKPQTYMNLSGEAVLSIMSYYKIQAKNIIIIHDDLDIGFSKIKYKFGGGNGGHRGLRSIDQLIGTNYHRIRCGIGRPLDNRIDISDFVLTKFTSDENHIISKKIEVIVTHLDYLFTDQIEDFQKTIALPN